ncbi:hypothetical protein BB8028_0005g01030 [Beauveria bassiana]|uniref:non-specific serine/threonine protein kinase n=1 Tax=Beauveria bassiana TaxID=176275 RepID=A0A2S7YFD1_BEABA|nr:hypothetical protein BB8028_0005g01030 [Beauveria bassiana]
MSLGTSTLCDFSWPEAMTFFRSSDQDQAFGAGVNQNYSFSSSLISPQTCPNSSLPPNMLFTFLLLGTHCKYVIENRIEEENLPDYNAARYYPTRIGEIIQDRYQVVGKLGYGATSTAWLARDMHHRRYVTLKTYINSASIGQSLEDELQI